MGGFHRGMLEYHILKEKDGLFCWEMTIQPNPTEHETIRRELLEDGPYSIIINPGVEYQTPFSEIKGMLQKLHPGSTHMGTIEYKDHSAGMRDMDKIRWVTMLFNNGADGSVLKKEFPHNDWYIHM